MLTRRGFLKASLAGASVTAVSACSTGTLLGRSAPPLQLVSAVNDAEGRHYIGGVDSSGQQRFQIPVAERCHGGCPQSPERRRVLGLGPARLPNVTVHVEQPPRIGGLEPDRVRAAILSTGA